MVRQCTGVQARPLKVYSKGAGAHRRTDGRVKGGLDEREFTAEKRAAQIRPEWVRLRAQVRWLWVVHAPLARGRAWSVETRRS